MDSRKFTYLTRGPPQVRLGPVLVVLGKGAANVGWWMMLLAMFSYLLIQGLEAVFSSLISNLPET